MKVTKKLFALLMALVMIMGLGLTASAATITINNANPGETYNAYKLFDVTVSGEAYSYSTTNTDLKAALEGIGLTFTTSADGGTYYVRSEKVGGETVFVTAEGTMSAADLAVKLKAIVNQLGNPVATETVGEGAESVTLGDGQGEGDVAELSAGYYFVTSTMGSLCFLQTNNSEVNIAEKNPEPTIEKEAPESVSIGQKVDYTVTITAQKGATNYKLHDKMSESLTFNNDVTVTLNDEAVINQDNENYTVTTENEDECTLEVAFTQAFCDTLNDNDKLVVSYTATVNEKAVTIDPSNNAQLSYGNNSRTETDTVTTKNYAFDIVKVDKEDRLLKDAEFKLYIKVEAEDVALQFVPTDTGYRVAMQDEDGTEVIKVTDGKVTIDGLASGTYYLEETKAPDGYNKLESQVTVVVGETDNRAEVVTVGEGADAYDEYVSGGIEVENVAGQLLPSTGGMGTTVIYIIGAVLVIGAGIVLVVRRRTNA